MKVKYTFCSVLMWISDLEYCSLHWLIIGTSVVSRNYRTDKLNYWLLKQQSWLGELTGRLLLQFSNYLTIESSSLFVQIFYCQSSLQSPSPQCNTIIKTNKSKVFGGIWTNESVRPELSQHQPAQPGGLLPPNRPHLPKVKIFLLVKIFQQIFPLLHCSKLSE